MMSARTAATQLGYLVGAVVGGGVIAGPGFPMLGLALAASMAVSAWLVVRIDDPQDRPAITARARSPLN
jgi:predicted MFS family arabinose efflux permease